MKNLVKFKNNLSVLLIVCLMITTYLFANTVCIPALPSMHNYFNTSIQQIQMIIILYTVGLGLSQFFYGPFSDHYGRRKTVLLGTYIFLCGSILTIFSSQIIILLCGRFIQGLGAGCYSVVSKSIANDIYKNEKYIEATIIMMLFSVLTQIIAPIIGGYLTSWFSWRANILAIFIYSSITLVIIKIFLPETSTTKSNSSAFYKNIWQNYYITISNYQFLTLLIISAFTLGSITLYQITSPFILQTQLGLSPIIYGWTALLTAGGFLLGNTIILILNKQINLVSKLYLGLLIMVIGAGCMLILSVSQNLTPYKIIIPMLIFNIGTGMVFPLSTAGALLQNQFNAGSAGAIIGGLQMLLIAAISFFISYLKLDTVSLAIVLLSISIFSLISLITYRLSSSRTVYETS